MATPATKDRRHPVKVTSKRLSRSYRSSARHHQPRCGRDYASRADTDPGDVDRNGRGPGPTCMSENPLRSKIAKKRPSSRFLRASHPGHLRDRGHRHRCRKLVRPQATPPDSGRRGRICRRPAIRRLLPLFQTPRTASNREPGARVCRRHATAWFTIGPTLPLDDEHPACRSQMTSASCSTARVLGAERRMVPGPNGYDPTLDNPSQSRRSVLDEIPRRQGN